VAGKLVAARDNIARMCAVYPLGTVAAPAIVRIRSPFPGTAVRHLICSRYACDPVNACMVLAMMVEKHGGSDF
jgi:hypothetical protein